MTAWIGFDPVLKDPVARRLAIQSVDEHIRQLPGIQQLAWSNGKPPGGGRHHLGDWKSDVRGAPTVYMEVESYTTGPDFFELYGIPLLRGRTLQPSDTAQDVLVGERFARALWPGLNPVGRSFTFEKEMFSVVGVVREIHHPSLDTHMDRPEFYTAFSGTDDLGHLSIRCRNTCPDPALVHRQVRAAHPQARVIEADVLDDVYFEQLAQPRAAAALGFAFAAISVLGASAGLFSVLSYSVGRRRREFGIRSALGASSGHIQRVVLRDALLAAISGMAIGIVASWFLARALASLQYGVTITDPLSWTIVLGGIGVTTMLASWRPARSATRVSPVLLLKED